MCIKNIPVSRHLMMLCIAITIVAASCIKPSDSLIEPSSSLGFDKGNLKKAIEGVDSLSLFYQAFNKAGYSGILASNDTYTLFAPGNTAMLSAGLNADKIRSLTADSLRKLVGYHILPGAYDNAAFEKLVITAFIPTLRVDTILIPQQKFTTKTFFLSVQKGDELYINNGVVAGNVSPVSCSNGFVYPVGKLINTAPIDESRTVWEVIESDPDLSLYRDAVILLDSIKQTDAYYDGNVFFTIISPPLDQGLLADRKTDPVSGKIYPRSTPAVLAPTNKAFNDAGFHSIDDIRAFAYRYPFGVTSWANDDFSEVMFYYKFSSLDTLLGRNILGNGIGDESRYPVRILYGDLLKGKINNGVFNRMVRPVYENIALYVRYPYDLQFTAENGVAYVQWRAGGERAMIPRDASTANPVNNYNLDNGVIYKIDKLFYPFN